jgi:hypothetical protein
VFLLDHSTTLSFLASEGILPFLYNTFLTPW